jgi:tetratricopeptide (TPR) repeat protein
LEPDVAEVHLSLGHAYLKLKKSSEAIKAFKESIRLNPEKEEAHYGLGVEYLRTNKNKEAAEAFKRAIKLRTTMGKAHYGLGLEYQEMQRRDLLVEQYRILETLDPALAKKLESTFPQLDWPCRVPPFCR